MNTRHSRCRISLTHRLLQGLLIPLVTLGLVADAPAQERHRVVVLTDYFKDPDDKQSMIRFLTYANEFDVEGLIATSLAYGTGEVHPEWIKETIDDYGKVLGSLRRHERPGFAYPSVEQLKAVVKAGAPVIRQYIGARRGFPVPYPEGARDPRASDPPEKWIGPQHDTEASRHIISVVDADDPRPAWVVIWGGGMDLAQAIWRVRNDRTPQEADAFVRKLRVYQISWQDTGAVWLWENEPELFLILSAEAFRGMYAEGEKSLHDEAWVNQNVRTGHGPLGATYPKAGATNGVKEGDSPSFLHLLARGLSEPERPEWGGWGGRFRRAGSETNFYVDARDNHPHSENEAAEKRWTVGRWSAAQTAEFAARMDWCVQPYDKANHPPQAHLNGDRGYEVLEMDVQPGEIVSLSAAGTSDPDGDGLNYSWWQYREAGGFDGDVEIRGADEAEAQIAVPEVERPATIHVVLEVTDEGTPPLTAYRRAVVTIAPSSSRD